MDTTLRLKVGELAQRTGVSIRTLHYYDEIGLLRPSSLTESGHRLYSVGDLLRLQQIKSLQQLGFSLEQIREGLGSSDFAPLTVIEKHIRQLDEQIRVQQSLRTRLEALASTLRTHEEASMDTLLQTMEAMTVFEQHYTPEQLDQLAKRKEEVGEERIREVEQEWKDLFEKVGAEMAKGTDPTSEPMRQLAQKWLGLIAEFTGGDPGIEKSLNNMYQRDPNVAEPYGFPFDQSMFDYVGKAIAALKKD